MIDVTSGAVTSDLHVLSLPAEGGTLLRFSLLGVMVLPS